MTFDLKSKATFEGMYTLIPQEDVSEFFSDDESDEIDPVKEHNGEWFLFTGILITRDGVEHEFVLNLGKDFKEDELSSIQPWDPSDYEGGEVDDLEEWYPLGVDHE